MQILSFHTFYDGFAFNTDKTKVKATIGILTDDYKTVKNQYDFYVGFISPEEFVYKYLPIKYTDIDKVGHSLFGIQFNANELSVKRTNRIFTIAKHKALHTKHVWNAVYKFNGFESKTPFELIPLKRANQ